MAAVNKAELISAVCFFLMVGMIYVACYRLQVSTATKFFYASLAQVVIFLFGISLSWLLESDILFIVFYGYFFGLLITLPINVIAMMIYRRKRE